MSDAGCHEQSFEIDSFLVPLTARTLRIPIYSGRVFRREAGHRSDLKPATIPK
jgi:hypothetical protein